MKKAFYIMVCYLVCLISDAQITISFRPMYGKQTVVWNDTLRLSPNADWIKLEKMKLYITDVAFFVGDSLVSREAESYHLLDSDDMSSFEVKVSTASHFNKLKFNIGVDSAISAGGAMGGALDPSKGMYWAWHSGYINMKLEGTSSLSKYPGHEFQLHLGGYQTPFNALQNKELLVSESRNIPVSIELDRFLTFALTVKDHVMSPSETAVLMSEKLRDCFINANR